MLKITKIPFVLGLNLCVLASGSGSNLKAIIKATKSRSIASKVALVISNNSASKALTTARQNKIPAYHLSAKLFVSPVEFDKKFLSLLKQYNIDLIILAGYMKMLSTSIVQKYKNKILNIHPALLPKFGGKGMFGINVHAEVLRSGENVTGATVHFVDEIYDNGAVILQKEVKVKSGDTPVLLQKRVLRAEHKLYPEAIKLFEDKRISVRNNKVTIK